MIKNRRDIPRALNVLGLLGDGVELGVRAGEFSGHLLREWGGTSLHLVDCWCPIPGGFPHQQSAEEYTAFREAVDEVVASIPNANFRTTIHVGYTPIVAQEFKDDSLDFIYVDAGHSWYEVTLDLEAWWPKVKSGGLVCGDDFAATDDPWHQVDKAVTDFLAKHGLTPTVCEDQTWWVAKP